MGTAAGMIAAARKSIGLRESPANTNYITKWYGMNGQPWCAMSISYWAAHSSNAAAVCPNGPHTSAHKYAYTVWFAQAFQKAKRWHSGTKGIKAGDIIFYDWNGSRSIGAIDHVGLVEKVTGGVIHTIEGNRSDKCARFVADPRFVVGYGRPAYSGATKAAVKKSDPDPFVVSLARTSQKVTKGKATWVLWNRENSDSRNQHTKSNPGILTSAKFCSINGKVYGCNGTHYFVAVNMKTKKERSVDVGTHKRNEVAKVVDALYSSEHLYLKFVPDEDGTIGAWAKGIYW